MYNAINLVVDKLQSSTEVSNIIQHIKTNHQINPVIHSYKEIFEESSDNTLFLLYLTDDEIKYFFKNHLGKPINIAIIPNAGCTNAMKNYGVSKDMFEAIEDGLNEALLSKIDILQCNDIIVLSRVIIGDMHGLNRFNIDDDSKLTKLKIFFSHLKHLTFNSYTLTTSKDQKIQTAASGITILEQSSATDKSTISDDLSIHDGKLNAFVLAPTSLLSYLWYLISIFFYQRISVVSLPKSLGFIKTSMLTIDSSRPMDYMIDGNLLSTKQIVLEVLQDGLNLHLGRVFTEKVKMDTVLVDEKDTIKVNSLPKGEVREFLIGGTLPFFKRADEEDFKELFISLRSSAKFSFVFLTLMILSTLLATTGLFANSAPVIIGAMILAPLMSPIVSLSMGVVRADRLLFVQSIRTLAIGIFMALVFSCLFTLLIPLQEITPEMQGRLNPNLLDLMVAIFSGIAGAYANSKEEVTKSLAGVAIAVALIPPLSVTGIGIGLGNMEVIYGSFLLFTTNLVGITLSAALTFTVLGYAPVKRAQKGLLYTSILMLLITIPLGFSFSHIVEINRYSKMIQQDKQIRIDNKQITLRIISLDTKNDKVYIELEVVSNEFLTHVELEKIKSLLEDKLKRKVVLSASSKMVIN